MSTPNGPFRRMVILGDSNAYGMCAKKTENEWPQILAYWLRKFQKVDIQVFNRAIPSNMISPRCPGFEQSCKPSLLERYRADCIDLKPDLVIIAQCLNDMRTGMPIQDYIEDLGKIVADIQKEAHSLVVLTGMLHQVYGCGYNDPDEFPWATRWDSNTSKLYNQAISFLAADKGALFVDSLAVMNEADWLLNPDCVHLNDLGHVLIGNAVFQVIASHCKGIADQVIDTINKEGVCVENTGGSDSSEEIRRIWEQHSQDSPELLSK
jgi:lysophospholipase L1-like esterase